MRHGSGWLIAMVAGIAMAREAEALTPAEKCEADKLKAAGKYALCRLKADSKAVRTGGVADYSVCDARYAAKWIVIEAAAGGSCPNTGDGSVVQTYLQECTDVTAGIIAGGDPPTPCGDGVVDLGEQCDFGSLNGATCISEGFAGGTLACGAGCVFDTSGCWNARFVDNGDGTVTDRQTALTWEKKTDDGSVHDKDDTYFWSATSPYTNPDGGLFTTFLGQLNNCTTNDGTSVVGGFAGHCDWRIPSIAELQGIMLGTFPCGVSPCIDESVFGPVGSGQAAAQWSATTDTSIHPVNAWSIVLVNGYMGPGGKVNNNFGARAVRGPE